MPVLKRARSKTMKKILGMSAAIFVMLGAMTMSARAGHHQINPCNPCAMKHEKMNPCDMTDHDKMNPCDMGYHGKHKKMNPCDMKGHGTMNPCNPCAGK
ncbi:MAG: hypothetical protein D6703_05770 [Zetaproteobacteria bacterium]|nr:MAG: hypothetical protein D6703_05770 [Zetaproteobacteria bacterium]